MLNFQQLYFKLAEIPGWVSLQQLALSACSLFTIAVKCASQLFASSARIIMMVPAFSWWSTASLVAILLPLDTAISITSLSHPTSIDWFNIEYSKHVGGPLHHSFYTLGIEGWGDDWCMAMAALNFPTKYLAIYMLSWPWFFIFIPLGLAMNIMCPQN